MKKIITFTILLTALSANSQQNVELDPDFGTLGVSGFNDFFYSSSMAVQADNKIIIAGGTSGFGISRMLVDGGIDTSFGTNGLTTITFIEPGPQTADTYVYDIAIQSDGKILVGGYCNNNVNQTDFALVRLNTDGSLDTTFNNTGILLFGFGSQEDRGYDIALQPDGKILMTGDSFTGSTRDIALARINSDGTFDTTFSEDGKLTLEIAGDNDQARAVAVQQDGKIVVSGYTYQPGILYSKFLTVRFTSTGEIDSTFGTNGIVTVDIASHNDMAYDMIIQPDGKIVVAGESNGSNDDFSIVRLTTNGVLDTSFSGDGKLLIPFGISSDYGRSIALQPDGKILFGGSTQMGSYQDIAIARINTDGTLDTSFSSDGKINIPILNGVYINDIALQSTGKILASGYSSTYHIMVARIMGANPLSATDFEASEFAFFPNPAKSTVTFTQSITTLSIYSLDGKLISEKSNFGTIADVSNLSKGVYFMKAITETGRYHTAKLIVN
ncbi:T9SS type A sorting domain-containing protein [Flavobacterium sp. Sd200]|uniref:T9SS type A sorting domain-containing protein n=1 Tax=Flavobacterium sp. Sd200 TaxID=2692211 RepID=UPI0013694C7F|nr:T9SS type A sorting domain-containing protein [Flavobacterium sp. Sd200]MXN91620.1 T9SS type A sorting domain-containing protein [Flavobacterium sp. Sd200]